MAISWKPVAASAGAALVIVWIGIAYVLGQQNAPASAPQAPVYAAAPAVPSAAAVAPMPQPVAAPVSPLQQAPAEPQTTVERFNALAMHVAGLEGEPLIQALWQIEANVKRNHSHLWSRLATRQLAG